MNCNVKSFKLAAIFLFVIIFCTACVSVGHDFSSDKVSHIKIGISTKSDMRSMFGSPWRVGLEDGESTWTYGRYHYGLFAEKNAKDLIILFDDTGVVASYTFSTTEHKE